jgi:TnpA family transposase
MSPLDIGLSWKEIVSAVFMFALVWYELKAIRRDITRLENKVEKHNSFDRRIVKLETLLEIKEHDAEIQFKK